MAETQDSNLQAAGLFCKVGNAHARAGAQLTISPLAIFDLHLYAGGVSYFGNFQTVVGYSEASTAVGSNADIADWVEQSGNQSPGRGMVLGARGVPIGHLRGVGRASHLRAAGWEAPPDLERRRLRARTRNAGHRPLHAATSPA